MLVRWGAPSVTRPEHDAEDLKRSPAAISAHKLAAVLGLPQSVFAFLEARIPEMRAIVDGRGRVYRAQDAILLAGLADMLYREGRPFRDVADMLGTPERAKILAHGRARLSGALTARVTRQDGGRTIPADALVGRKGEALQRRPAAVPSAELEALLGELIACVRLLESGR